MAQDGALRQEMVRIGRSLYDRQLIVAAEGNLSARLGDGRFLVTPAGFCKGDLTEADLLVVDARADVQPPAGPAIGPGESHSRRPSSEWPLHREIYAQRPDVGAICHGHPAWATAFAAARLPLDGCLLPEIVATLRSIPLAPYGTPGTEELPASARALIRDHDALLLANHGVVAVARSLREAFYRLESVERLAKVTLLARLAGGEHRLTAAEAAALAGPAKGSDSVLASPLQCIPGPGGELAGRGDLEALAERVAGQILAELRTSGARRE